MAEEKGENLSDDFEFVEDAEETAANGREAGDAVKKLREKLKECQKERQEYLDGWQRAKADLINERRDFEKQREEFVKFAKEDFLIQILPVVDSLEMAFKETARQDTDDKWQKGIENIYTQLLSVLKENGISQINPEGEQFDPNLHDSVEAVFTDSEKSNNRIVEVLQKGYILNGKIIRPARVKVAQYSMRMP